MQSDSILRITHTYILTRCLCVDPSSLRFDCLDRDGSGEIDCSELSHPLLCTGLARSALEVGYLVSETRLGVRCPRISVDTSSDSSIMTGTAKVFRAFF